MTQAYEDKGKCKRCHQVWKIVGGDADIYAAPRRGSRRDITQPASLRCPFCGSGLVQIIKEKAR